MKIYLPVLLFFLCSQSVAQPPYNMQPEFLKMNTVWVFGTKAGVDFRSGIPVAIESQHRAIEGAAAVAHPASGRLQFYSNGGTCWNAQHQPMPNGSGLLGNGGNCNNCLSTRQGVCIVPVIGTPGSYYLFSLMGATNAPATYDSGSLFYSIVNMSLDNGRGDIVPGTKNTVLSSDSLSECMIAIPGENCDIWLLMHEMENHRFRAYHITAGGINPNPVISHVPTSIIGPESFIMSELTVSSDRRKIALTSQSGNGVPLTGRGILLAEFDPATGIVSNGFNVMHTSQYGNFYPGSVSFSPDDSILYASTYDGPGKTNVIYQFDVRLYDSATIVNSVLRVDTLSKGTPITFKLYNNKIYLTEFDQADSYLHCINNPNVWGKGYNLQQNILKFLPGTYATLSLGNHVVAPPAIEGIREFVHDVTICDGQSITLEPTRQSAGTYIWDDRSASPFRTVSAPGTYQVISYQSGCDVTKETFHVVSGHLDPQISVEGFVLFTTKTYGSYQWLLNEQLIPGANGQTYQVTENGFYQVIVTEDDCLDTSDVYYINNVSADDISGNSAVRIYPNPARDVVYISSPEPVSATLSYLDGRVAARLPAGDTFIVMHGLASGIYLLRVVDAEGKLLRVEKVVKE